MRIFIDIEEKATFHEEWKGIVWQELHQSHQELDKLQQKGESGISSEPDLSLRNGANSARNKVKGFQVEGTDWQETITAKSVGSIVRNSES